VKINKKFFKKRIFTPSNSVGPTVDKVHAVRPVDDNNDMLFPSQLIECLGGRTNKKTHPLGIADKKTHPLVTRQR